MKTANTNRGSEIIYIFSKIDVLIKFIFFFTFSALVCPKEIQSQNITLSKTNFIISHGGVIRGDTTVEKIAMVFTGDEFADGGNYIAKTLKQQNIHGSFFLTGNFYRNPKLKVIIKELKQDGNYLGSHSDKHLLYCDWDNRDSLLVTHQQFKDDLQNAYAELNLWGIEKKDAHYFLPPYEWYNDSISVWTKEMGLQLIDFSPGTRSNADYTYPYEVESSNGLNGFILLVHIGTDPRRTDKFYNHLPELIKELKSRGYQFVRIDELLN